MFFFGFSDKGETAILHNEISSIIDRLSSPRKDKPTIDNDCNTENFRENELSSELNEQSTAIETDRIQYDFIEKMQTENDGSVCETIALDTVDVEKYRQMIPYNTTDMEKIAQQESLLDFLLINGICNDETFKIFIAEPDLHKERATKIVNSLYHVDKWMPIEYENESTIEWINSVESLPATVTPTHPAISIDTNNTNGFGGDLVIDPNPTIIPTNVPIQSYVSSWFFFSFFFFQF